MSELAKSNKEIFTDQVLDHISKRKISWIDINDSSWLNNTITVGDKIIEKACFMYQGEDDSVLVGFSIKNGTEQELKVDKILFEAKDEILGKLFSFASAGDYIKANTSKMFLVNVPSENISPNVVNQTWSGHMSFNIVLDTD